MGDHGVDDRGNLGALLLLAEGRFPSGAHAHSGGFEGAASLEDIADVAGLERFLLGRLHTVGSVAAAFAAAACAVPPERLVELDMELDARSPSPAVRAASRRLGRQLLRAGRRIWPDPALDAVAERIPKIHQPLALGAVAASAGLRPPDAALAAAHDSTIGPATAAVRLLGLDPFAVHAALARLAPEVTAVASDGAAHAESAPADLPSLSAPLLDIAAQSHDTWEVRLFAS